jgi:hypothetical protein
MARTTTTWKPGESGNKSGRPPKGYSITEYFKEMLSSDPATKEKLAKAILDKALTGDTSAIKLIWESVDGKPQQRTDITSDDKPLPIPIMGGASICGLPEEKRPY